jgi:hypothetical protein
MVLTASLCDVLHMDEFELGKLRKCIYAVGLRLTMLQIYLYQYWTVAEMQKKGRSAPRPCTARGKSTYSKLIKGMLLQNGQSLCFL